MAEQSEHEEQKQVKASPPFHKRWNIEVNSGEAKRNFVSRVLNLIEVYLPSLQKRYHIRERREDQLLQLLATELGARYQSNLLFSDYIEQDFIKLLHALEGIFKVFGTLDEEASQMILQTMVIKEAISLSEVDLGIEWRDGLFYQSGAKLLDEALVNENLKWLSAPKYEDVLTPFEKGLRHFLEAQKQPEKLTDVITDMYEALEKMARITNGNNKTLGSNAEQFVNNLSLSDHYETMLREYTKYAHEFRHAVEQGKERVPPLPNEVEAFVYTTGLFIRLAIQQSSRIAQSD